ncbi:hypothetical protein PMSD_17185 [Paenibacillus macquariensis subsp. defensor]|nr:hypothetical protein PMSD_17185 [Paenibacillus macquariensis subsp. defensor]
MRRGYVYVLTNEALAESVKVGKTTKSPEERARVLSSSTSIPTPFKVAYSKKFYDVDKMEKVVHTVLKNKGISKNKEFFYSDVETVVNIIENLRTYYSKKVEVFINYDDSDNITTYSVDVFYCDGDIYDNIPELSRSGFNSNEEATHYSRELQTSNSNSFVVVGVHGGLD